MPINYEMSSSSFSLVYSASFEGTKRAAEQGDADAQYSLGLFYVLQQDYKQGKEWYEKAAKQGHADAQAGLSGLYYLGLGVRQDYQKARACLQTSYRSQISEAARHTKAAKTSASLS